MQKAPAGASHGGAAARGSRCTGFLGRRVGNAQALHRPHDRDLVPRRAAARRLGLAIHEGVWAVERVDLARDIRHIGVYPSVLEPR